MRIGVLGGSFNPPTIAHLEVSERCIQEGFCDKVIWVPVNDSYRKVTNIPAKNRLDMVKLALEDEKNKNIGYSEHELKFNRIIRTLESLDILQSYLPNDDLLFIAGADKLGFSWMQKEEFISKYDYILINRGNIDCENIIVKSDILSKYKNKIHILSYTSDISSSNVRYNIKRLNYSSDVTESVLDYIIEHKLY